MNFRILYLVFVLVFGYLLFFSWSQENKEKAAAIAAVEVDQSLVVVVVWPELVVVEQCLPSELELLHHIETDSVFEFCC